MDARDLLNVDCWAKVFESLEAEDLLNLGNVWHSFRLIMNNPRYGFEGKWKFHLVLPQLIPFLGDRNQVRSALKLRSVCKTWKNSIDKILEERDLCPKMSFETFEIIDEFLEEFRTANPGSILCRRLCLGRYVEEEDEDDLEEAEDGEEEEEVDEEGEEEDEEDTEEEIEDEEVDVEEEDENQNAVEEDPLFLQSAILFVQKFGMNVWELYVSQQPPTFLQILQHLPNLKTFQLKESGEDNERDPLPELPQLTRIETGNATATFRPLINYGRQLEHLVFGELSFLPYLPLERRRRFFQQFGALKTLDFSVLLENATNIIATLPFLNCPLESFTIRLYSYFEESWQIDTFLRSINHLQLLQNLTIGLDNVYFRRQLQLEDYSNSSITHLEIILYGSDRNKMSLYFLPALTHLQHLTLKFNHNKVIQLGLQTSEDLRDGIKIRDFFNNLHLRQYHAYEDVNSNIWDTIESLREVILQFRDSLKLHFSREECISYRKLRA